MGINVFPLPSGGLSGFSIDVIVPNTAAFGKVSLDAGVYDLSFFPSNGGTPTVSVNFLDGANLSVGGSVLQDVDTGSTNNQVVGRLIATSKVSSVSVFSTTGGWLIANQLQSVTNIKKVYKLTASGTVVLTAQARVLAIGGGGGGGPCAFNSGLGGGGGGSGYYSVGTLNAGSYGYTIGGGGGRADYGAVSGNGGTSTISTISAAGGTGGRNGNSGGTGGNGGSGGSGGSNNIFEWAQGGINGSNGTTPPSGGTGGIGSGVAPEGWVGNAPQLQASPGAAGSFAQGGAGGTLGLHGEGAYAAANTGGGGGGSNRAAGSDVFGTGGGSGAIYYYYL